MLNAGTGGVPDFRPLVDLDVLQCGPGLIVITHIRRPHLRPRSDIHRCRPALPIVLSSHRAVSHRVLSRCHAREGFAIFVLKPCGCPADKFADLVGRSEAVPSADRCPGICLQKSQNPLAGAADKEPHVDPARLRLLVACYLSRFGSLHVPHRNIIGRTKRRRCEQALCSLCGRTDHAICSYTGQGRTPRQYSPIEFGEGVDPASVEGVQRRRQQTRETRRLRDFEAERRRRGEQLVRPAKVSVWSPLRCLWA